MQSILELAETLPDHRRFDVYEVHCHGCKSDFRCAVDLAHETDCPMQQPESELVWLMMHEGCESGAGESKNENSIRFGRAVMPLSGAEDGNSNQHSYHRKNYD